MKIKPSLDIRTACLAASTALAFGTFLIIRERIGRALDLRFDPADSIYWNEGV